VLEILLGVQGGLSFFVFFKDEVVDVDELLLAAFFFIFFVDQLSEVVRVKLVLKRLLPLDFLNSLLDGLESALFTFALTVFFLGLLLGNELLGVNTLDSLNFRMDFLASFLALSSPRLKGLLRLHSAGQG